MYIKEYSKRGRITIAKEARKKWVYKRGFCRFFTYKIDRTVKIIKFNFVWKKAMKQIDSLRKQKLLLS